MIMGNEPTPVMSRNVGQRSAHAYRILARTTRMDSRTR